jgi:hypothetical protein
LTLRGSADKRLQPAFDFQSFTTYGPFVFNSRKKALPAVGMMLTLLFVPSSLKPPVKFDHVNEFKAHASHRIFKKVLEQFV